MGRDNAGACKGAEQWTRNDASRHRKGPPSGGARLDAFIERSQCDPFEVIEDERAAHKQYTPSLPRFVRVTRAEGLSSASRQACPRRKPDTTSGLFPLSQDSFFDLAGSAPGPHGWTGGQTATWADR